MRTMICLHLQKFAGSHPTANGPKSKVRARRRASLTYPGKGSHVEFSFNHLVCTRQE
jgi:hypothetical protein